MQRGLGDKAWDRGGTKRRRAYPNKAHHRTQRHGLRLALRTDRGHLSATGRQPIRPRTPLLRNGIGQQGENQATFPPRANIHAAIRDAMEASCKPFVVVCDKCDKVRVLTLNQTPCDLNLML